MNIKEISVRQIANHIDDTYSLKDFFALIKEYDYRDCPDIHDEFHEPYKFEKMTGLKFKYVDDYRSRGSGAYDSWDYIFSLEDSDSNKRFFMAQAAYNYHGGTDFYGYDFWEVKQVEVTIKKWVGV